MTYQVIQCNMTEKTVDVFENGLTLEKAAYQVQKLNEGSKDITYFVLPWFVDIDDSMVDSMALFLLV